MSFFLVDYLSVISLIEIFLQWYCKDQSDMEQDKGERLEFFS